MKKILFINIFGNGHFNPTLGLVKELINRGEQVTYIADESFREKIEDTGAEFKGHKDISNLINKYLNSGNIKPSLKLIVKFKALIEEILEEVLNSKEKFDYIIYDLIFILGSELGKILEIPTICSITTFAVNEKTNCFLSQFNEIKPKIQKFLNSKIYIRFVKRLQIKYGIKFPSISDAFTGMGMIKIVYTSKYFQLCGESFDESYKFIGPSITDRNENMKFSLETYDKSKIIYISLGTIFNNSIEFYESCFKAFGNMDAKIVMSVGKGININKFRSVPSNFIIRNYVPQLEILKSADVFITHGGMNSTNEGLYYGVPLILIPQSIDQPAVANRVVEVGAGIVIEKDKVTPDVLRQSVVEIFSDNEFRINGEKVGKSLREAGGYKKGVDEIFKLKNEN
ncbi:macrolide family glycosyltransferase [Clostridium psychrophilum]|uniref:macrolide family glycosyltransferase n=1 Tax=Clostridium psychrophilum TaxID=132926 RepID=UPI001C0C1FC1|nr:macrolide family glycosyltransferase [Clostridium psychrophilum]MBU3181862.1 glycosyl transferase [Clostridium psychrophilum]